MQDYIARKIDINGNIETVTVKQFDCNSRFLHVTISDIDLPEEYMKIFEMEGCAARLLVAVGHDKYAYVDGEIADAEGGIVTFLLPGSVTQRPGTYLCEIRITEPESGALISTKPFTMRVEGSINADGAIEATPQYTALENALMKIDRNERRMDALAALADAGELPAGSLEAEVVDARTGWDGTMGYDAGDSAFKFGSTAFTGLGDALASQVAFLRDTGLIYLGTLLNSQTWSTATVDNTRTFAGLPNNIFAVCNTVEAVNPIADAPVSGPMSGLIVTFGRGDKHIHRNFDTQLFLPQDCGSIRARKFNGSAWSDWKTVGGDDFNRAVGELTSALEGCQQFRADINAAYADYGSLLSRCTQDGAFFVSSTPGGSGERRWTDLPTDRQNFIVVNARYSENWLLQTAVPTDSLSTVYRRLIPRTAGAGAPREWALAGEPDRRLKVLAVGDSICRGWRNGIYNDQGNFVGRGFAALLGLPYLNLGESGATLSTVRNDVTNIPSQLAGATGFQPDILLADGGINDYTSNAPLGEVPSVPAESADGLAAGTVMGGLQKLFLTMAARFPHAQRFFIITHKVCRDGVYLPATPNGAGYTQQQLHDAIAACCRVYNVRVIDVYEDSLLNSFFAAYRADTHYTYTPTQQDVGGWAAATANTTDYTDRDGVHPLQRGYLEGYVPLIREAIRVGTVK